MRKNNNFINIFVNGFIQKRIYKGMFLRDVKLFSLCRIIFHLGDIIFFTLKMAFLVDISIKDAAGIFYGSFKKPFNGSEVA